jgi:carbon-monoxide dehydrogenase medium subunit/2-furoyl-CoA dehydrogenase FAD binding subunit
MLEIDEHQAIQHIRLGVGGLAETPLLIAEAQHMVGEQWTAERGRALAESVVECMAWSDDPAASADYRRQLARVLLSRVLESAYRDAQAREVIHATHTS